MLNNIYSFLKVVYIFLRVYMWCMYVNVGYFNGMYKLFFFRGFGGRVIVVVYWDYGLLFF